MIKMKKIELSGVRPFYFFILVFFLLASCSPRVAVMRGYNFSEIKKIGVLTFAGSFSDGYNGDAIGDEFTRQFMMRGITVVERKRLNEVLREQNFGDASQREYMRDLNEKLGIDVLITGTVVKWIPDKKNYVVLGDLNNPASEVKTRIITTDAEVGISVRMIDLKTGNIVWSSIYTYESFNLEDAIYGSVSYLVSGLRPFWKGLEK